MQDYKEWYEHYEGTAVHKGIAEVTAAEREFSELLSTITDPALKAAFDTAAGKLARAYEMQGFNMGRSVATSIRGMNASEVWKPVDSYIGLYEVSSLGRVRSTGRGRDDGPRMLAPELAPDGHYVVTLYKNGAARSFPIRFLVAKAFIPNPHGKPQVRQKNLNKGDNRAKNLYWTNESGTTNAPVVQIDDEGNEVQTFFSVGAAARGTGIKRASIARCCKGKAKTAGGYRWSYK